jgi:phospholipase D1/2
VIPDARCADCYLIGDPAAIHGPEDVGAKSAVQGLGKIGLKTELPDATLDERSSYTRDSEKASGFADALVPTLKGKVVTEHLPAAEHTHGMPIEEKLEKEDQEKPRMAPGQARVGDGQMFGAPADASSAPETGGQRPHAQMGKNDADVEEQKVPPGRPILQKHLSAKSCQSPWTVPTPRPKYDADSFEDPVCDEFWKGIWVACAAHNVGARAFPS